jgi:16S rRNA (adenine1518-N6/adenine1519-N6)-dimethyltransferase
MEHPRNLLAAHGLDAKKSLGQSFLFDDQLLTRIAEAAQLEPDDQVLEIGPGLGHLTVHLAARAGRVVAVELDQRLLPLLAQQLAAETAVDLVHADILDIDPTHYFGARPYKVVGNVPYYITGAILRHLLSDVRPPELMVLTVQKEVASRLTAPAGQLSLLAVSVRFFGAVEQLATIKAGAFWPRPNVDSAVVRIDLKSQPSWPVSEKAFFRVVRVGFAQKRKQLKNNLNALGLGSEAVQTALADAGIDGRRRAETLSLEEWVALTEVLEAA